MSTDTPEQQPTVPAPPAAADPTPAALPPTFGAPPPVNPDIFSSIAAAKPRARITLTSILLAAAAVVAVAGIAFAVGRVTAPSGTANPNGFGRALNGGNGTFNARNGAFPGANGNGNGGGLFGAANGGIELRGTVTSVDGDRITVQLANGQSVKVQTSSSTTYHTQASGSASDVSNGKSVIVQVGGATGLRGLFGQGGTGNTGTATIPATDVTVAGS
jgi:hypothetical protein